MRAAGHAPRRGRAELLCVAAAQRPPPRSPPPRQGPGAGPGGGPALRLPLALERLAELWRRVSPTDACAEPRGSSSLGRRVRVLVNRFALRLGPQFTGAHVYAVSVTPRGGEPQPAAPELRARAVAAVARERGWPDGSWQFDAPAGRLFSLAPLAPPDGGADVALPAAGGAPEAVLRVTLAPDPAARLPAAPSGGPGDAAPLQALGLLLRASLCAALPQAIPAARVMLLPPGSAPRPAAPPASTSRGGHGGRGGGSRGGRGGRGPPGGGRGGAPGDALGPLQLWTALAAGAKPTEMGWTLQLDTSRGAVLPAGELAELLVGGAGGAASPAELCGSRAKLAAAESLVKGAKVQVRYPTGAQSRVVRGLDARPPARYTFKPPDGSTTTVAAHWAAAHGVTLAHGHDWPCVMVSARAAIPLELCAVAAPQPRRALNERQTAELIKTAALPPEVRLRAIRAIVAGQLSGFRLRLLQAWGVSISPEPLEVPGRVLPDALLECGGGTCAEPSNQGAWRPPARAVTPARLQRWVVINLGGAALRPGVDVLLAQLVAQLRAAGGSVAPPEHVAGGGGGRAGGARSALEAAAAAAGGRPQLVLVVLPERSSAQYGELKGAAAALGLVTQVVVAPRVGLAPGRVELRPAVAANLALKVTAKAGGASWQLPGGPRAWAGGLCEAPLQVLGIDVGHAGAGGGPRRRPSVAAVVGSLDAGASRYAAAVSEQSGGEELVLGLADMAAQVMAAHAAANGGAPPRSLLVFRDGVSESRYAAVIREEVAALRAAAAAVAPRGAAPPKVRRGALPGGGRDAVGARLTFVVVSRSHGLRLLPHPDDPSACGPDRGGNVPPGTVVDRGVTAPLAAEFYLNCHAGIQGTNRPARFNVLVDEIGLSQDGLQLLCFHLASTHAACARTIAVPAAVRYADKAATLGAFTGGVGAWREVQAPAPGVPARAWRPLQAAQRALARTPGPRDGRAAPPAAARPAAAARRRGSSSGSTGAAARPRPVLARSQAPEEDAAVASQAPVDDAAVTQFDVDSGKAEQLAGVGELGPREDDVLPDSLADAITDAAAATASAINSGVLRCQVEILLPEFWDPISGPIFPNKGDQERFWRMTRRFVEALGAALGAGGGGADGGGGGGVKAIYPDAGVAAMLSYQWGDRSFAIDSLNARRPVSPDDELIVLCCPDPPGAEEAQRAVRQVGEQDEAAGSMERPIVLFNQRLSSGDVGIGLNARRLRSTFLQRFNVTYSLRPVGEVGTVFRRYPGLWKVFVEEPALPGRYRLAAEQPNRPAGEALDLIIMTALDPDAAAAAAAGGGGAAAAPKGLLESLGSTMASMQRFMRSLSQ
ncbi:AGO3 [Scenedesmus sp. PABB004]|nr:AGO3 [Scenedesmus sp. PABB004]